MWLRSTGTLTSLRQPPEMQNLLGSEGSKNKKALSVRMSAEEFCAPFR
jgi:hypothetical protein